MTKHTRTTKQSKKQGPAEKRWTVGIDLGDQWSRYCVLDEEGEIAEEGRFKTTPGALTKHFGGLGADANCSGSRYALAVGQ